MKTIRFAMNSYKNHAVLVTRCDITKTQLQLCKFREIVNACFLHHEKTNIILKSLQLKFKNYTNTLQYQKKLMKN